ncbi:hypothetical protein ACLOJK_000410 [Asimina triloba]
MATLLVTPNAIPKNLPLINAGAFRLSFRHSHSSLFSSSTDAIRFQALGCCGWKRSSGSGVGSLSGTKRRTVVAAGQPSTTSLIFAFVFPLSLLLVTILTSIRIADKLDQQYLEELALNEEIMEEDMMEEEGQEVNIPYPAEEEPAPAVPRSRNRPKREA